MGVHEVFGGPMIGVFNNGSRDMAEASAEVRSSQAVTPRYELVIRLAGVIRSHRDRKGLLQLLVSEPPPIVHFDALRASPIIESITGQRSEVIASAVQHQTWLPFRVAAFWVITVLVLLAPARTSISFH
jgi:hypothetical protein